MYYNICIDGKWLGVCLVATLVYLVYILAAEGFGQIKWQTDTRAAFIYRFFFLFFCLLHDVQFILFFG